MVEFPTERDWYRGWQSSLAGLPRALEAGREVELAIRAGSAADRLAWVFMSGYQAAVRYCFPEFAGSGWSCFAAAEPKVGPHCRLESTARGYRLSGEKSWIAGAESVDRLVVVVGEAEDRRFVCVERDSPGVTIALPRSPSFLAELSQGAAVFDGVAVTGSQLLSQPERAYWFRAAEPLFVLIALNACLGAQATAEGLVEKAATKLRMTSASAIECGTALAQVIPDRQKIKAGLTELRGLTAVAMAHFVADALPHATPALQRSWQTDARFLEMFGVTR